jgi:hypothetical protein
VSQNSFFIHTCEVRCRREVCDEREGQCCVCLNIFIFSSYYITRSKILMNINASFLTKKIIFIQYMTYDTKTLRINFLCSI